MRSIAVLSIVGVLFSRLVLCGADAPLPPRQKPLPVKAFYENFEEVSVKKDTGLLFAPGVYLGTAGTPAHYNSLTLGWGASGVLWSKPVAIVYIRENRFSFRYFEENPVFVLSWYGKKERPALMKIFGGTSGRDTDKEKLSGFTPVETPGGSVTYLQAEKVVICRKVLRTAVPAAAVPGPLQARLGRDGFVHIQYTGEVLSVWRRKAGK
ncbi:MAG: flavin reductase [Lentisphaeria bacterium]|nr:flavin reductase [Lentisphaeria bacterium]